MAEPATSKRCYACFRPRHECYCDAVPQIDNRTQVLIVQHARERFHPFNTARMVHRALRNSQLLIGHPGELAGRLSLAPRAGLLYPEPDSLTLDAVPRDALPEQLVILDGTWHHAKTLLRDIPALRTLPRFQLTPQQPSRFRIRRQPNPLALSTVEAAVAALTACEPATVGLAELLNAFNVMVERQLSHPKVECRERHTKRRRPALGNVPAALLGSLDHVVVAYGESAQGGRGCDPNSLAPLYWVAERIGSGERLCCALAPMSPLSNAFLGHLALPAETFAGGATLGEFEDRWRAFVRPDDLLVAFNQSTPRLLSHVGHDPGRWLLLKSIDMQSPWPFDALDDDTLAAALPAGATCLPGRAGRRLAWTIAYVKYLNHL
ncbi:MAG: DTW domain-containing protein [Planctomycetes bacterium]|nr:DTW domain-containing protein [Planctomycetota bacterium]